jgi:GNAT superfamily N-acetyltransferase
LRAATTTAADPTPPAATIRAARPADAALLADLAVQLGYPVTTAEIEDRLQSIEEDDAAVLVACDGDDRPLGWAHVELRRTLVEPLSAQVMGLVVADGSRGAGTGRDLLSAMEAWALARGSRRMLVGTRVTRERAHRFYAREGYEVLKTSYFLVKQLAG